MATLCSVKSYYNLPHNNFFDTKLSVAKRPQPIQIGICQKKIQLSNKAINTAHQRSIGKNFASCDYNYHTQLIPDQVAPAHQGSCKL